MARARLSLDRVGGLATSLALSVALAGLGGCAASARQAAATPPAADLDCGFRAPTSCWTLGPRLPPRVAQPPDSALRQPAPPSPVLVRAAPDSAPSELP